MVHNYNDCKISPKAQHSYNKDYFHFRISDATGKMNFELVKEGDISKDLLDSNVS